jgi:hypothetical protein
MNVFTVSPRHPKLSFVSKISPSPDWFTGIFFASVYYADACTLNILYVSLTIICLTLLGISAMDLCLSNCSWIEKYSEDLYPLDAGIDSGKTYTVGSG